MIAANTGGASAYQGKIKVRGGELRRVVEDLDRAVNVEALRRTKETGEYSFSPILDRSFSIVPCRAAPFA